MRICKKCLIAKPETEYYKSRPVTCKVCVRKVYAEYQKSGKFKSYRIEYDKRYRIEHKSDRQQYFKDWQRKSRHKRDAVKAKAHYAVEKAIKNGVLFRPSICESCGISNPKLHGHHTNYSKQLIVVWLCPSCHRLTHTRNIVDKA